MIVSVLSGKGGTGKTLVSVNLAAAAEQTTYVDCDVEEPNGHLFLKPEITDTTPVSTKVPEINMDLCTRCRTCVNFCKYNALALVKDKILVFHEICHSCGGCALLCPAKAITETERTIGRIEEGLSAGVRVLTGYLNPGEVSGVPIIKELLARLPKEGDAVIDCPPGSACVVMESIRDADYCVLVAEPTLFGVHNLSMVYELVQLFEKPFGVVLNKCLPEENPAETFCLQHQIPVLAKIPYDETLGLLNSRGSVLVREQKAYQAMFSRMMERIKKEVAQ
ncbi:MAG: 4Fe-4S binding protein [Oscillospiraceae bacterium]|jgi:MinD superfamily P-loop ATPase